MHSRTRTGPERGLPAPTQPANAMGRPGSASDANLPSIPNLARPTRRPPHRPATPTNQASVTLDPRLICLPAYPRHTSEPPPPSEQRDSQGHGHGLAMAGHGHVPLARNARNGHPMTKPTEASFQKHEWRSQLSLLERDRDSNPRPHLGKRLWHRRIDARSV